MRYKNAKYLANTCTNLKKIKKSFIWYLFALKFNLMIIDRKKREKAILCLKQH